VLWIRSIVNFQNAGQRKMLAHKSTRYCLLLVKLKAGLWKTNDYWYNKKSHPGPEAAQKRVVLITHEKKG